MFEKVVDLLTESRTSRQNGTQCAPEHLLVVPDDLARTLIANPVLEHKIATYDLLHYAMKDPGKYLALIPTEKLQRGHMIALDSLMPAAAAEVIDTTFFNFVRKYSLADTMQDMGSEQIQVIAVFLNHLLRTPPKRIHISERLDLIQKKETYTPADAIPSPAVPHFFKVSSGCAGATEHAQATMQGPFICQLCGDGFVTTHDLWKHAEKQHHSWLECRKRLIFEVQQLKTVPLQPIEKRRLASNFYQDLLHSYPARNTLRPGQCSMRQIVACVTCAVKDWIDDFYPCFAWTEAPSTGAPGATEHEDEEAEAEDEDDAEGTSAADRRNYGPQLRDEHGFCYFGPADKIDALLNVDNYRHVVPLEKSYMRRACNIPGSQRCAGS